MKKVLFMAMVAVTFFSCSNEKDETVQTTKSVVVHLASSSLSRAVEAPLGEGAKASIMNYNIFFLDAAGKVVKGGQSGDIISGAIPCTAVDKSAVSVYVVANAGKSPSWVVDLSGIEVGSTLADIKAKVAKVETQTTVANIVLANTADAGNGVIQTGATADANYTATVKIAPVLSRLEIGKIEGIGENSEKVNSFKVEGIYIDGHAVEFNVGGGYNSALNVADYTKNGIYSIGVDLNALSTYPEKFRDLPALEANSAIVVPTDSKVWAYQLAAGAPLPKIIVKLSNVNGEGASTYKYVTVSQYKVGGVGYSENLKPGTLYKIGSIQFKLNETSIVPNASEKDVDVTIEIKAWDVVNLEPVV